MNRDTSVSAFSSEFAFENRNIRLSTNEGNTMMSWVNEKGTKKATYKIDTTPFSTEKIYKYEIEGKPVGTAIINHQLVLFTAVDGVIGNIYVFEASSGEYDYTGKLLAHNNYYFDINHPLETLVSYESDIVQKVYWTDSVNQLRCINIAATPKNGYGYYTDKSFDFKLPASIGESSVVNSSPVRITKLYGSGEFPSGVIQYALTYYNKYGQETNIFYVSPLQYISYLDRGGSPEEKIANSFRIEIDPVPYEHEYLRIYSIMRTSINATPVVKRVIDIKLEGTKTISYTDTGTNGDTVDPTELLYKNSNAVTAETLEQKDNTLFLGGIKTIKNAIPKDIRTTLKYYIENNLVLDPLESEDTEGKIVIASKRVTSVGTIESSGDFKYINSIGISGYKYKEWYRVGIQFQDTLGTWSEPTYITDYQIQVRPDLNYAKGEIYTPQIEITLPSEICAMLQQAGYNYARLLIAEPSVNDRTIICQGIINPTVYQNTRRYKLINDGTVIDNTSKGSLYGQSSWLFRPKCSKNIISNLTASDGGGYVRSEGTLCDVSDMDISILSSSGYTNSSNYLVSKSLNATEIGCNLNNIDKINASFYIDQNLVTLHSPEITFDETLYNRDWEGSKIRVIGEAKFTNTFGAIDIQTSSPTIGSAGGFRETTIKTEGNAALVSGLYYEDFIVDDDKDDNNIIYKKYAAMEEPVKWPVYMWHHNGSLNNDCNRDVRSAQLSKKKISNYHLSTKVDYYGFTTEHTPADIKCFYSDELSLLKVNGNPYMGNIDTMLAPEKYSFKYFSKWPFEGRDIKNWWTSDYYNTIKSLVLHPERCAFRLANRLNFGDDSDDGQRGIYAFLLKEDKTYGWIRLGDILSDTNKNIGDLVSDLNETSEGVRIKYKSTPHLVAQFKKDSEGANIFKATEDAALPIVEVYREIDMDTLYGGKSEDALKANNWIPISEPFILNSDTVLISGWGDTYYQTYECLKTYAFTEEDINQVIDIASFICETHVNIDGRYDKNRMQINNLNMSPQNFNLINPVYSQLNNFFSYKIVDEDTYDTTEYKNVVTWTLTKQSGADVDVWTNVTLASTLELDGDKGAITKLTKLNDQLITFQDKGFAQILYNEQTQITSTEGVPIEIANSGKVQGKRYFSNTVGCSNKYSITVTPSGIYFMDSNNKSIYMFNGQLANLSTAGGFNSWAKKNIPAKYRGGELLASDDFVSYYDQLNQEILFINNTEALAFSEKFNCFTSFYDYGGAPYFCNLDDRGLWITEEGIWIHQEGEYCNFFEDNRGYSITLIGNQEPQADKIFTNLEFRACVTGEGDYNETSEVFTPSLPFDSLEVWDEYQHGKLDLSYKNGRDRFTHGTSDNSSHLARKFRIWRCDIPRDNASINGKEETEKGIKRFKVRPLDRIRNPWVYIELRKKAASPGTYLNKTEVHDIVASYFS